VIGYSRRAAAQVDALLDHYADINRPEAMRNLLVAMREARLAILASPTDGLGGRRDPIQT